MSNIKARFFNPTGYEYFDNAKEIVTAVWKFIKHEYKNKSKKDSNTEGIPYRYWETHAVPIHNEAWRLMCLIRDVYDLYPTDTTKKVQDRKEVIHDAISCCNKIGDLLSLTRLELDTNPDKMSDIFDLLDKEVSLLRGTLSSVRLSTR